MGAWWRAPLCVMCHRVCTRHAAKLFVGNHVFVPRGTYIVPTHPFTNGWLSGLVWPPFELLLHVTANGEEGLEFSKKPHLSEVLPLP